jgi:hypothetical protein
MMDKDQYERRQQEIADFAAMIGCMLLALSGAR